MSFVLLLICDSDFSAEIILKLSSRDSEVSLSYLCWLRYMFGFGPTDL